MQRRLAIILGAVSFVRDVIACAFLGREPAWVATVRDLTEPPQDDERVNAFGGEA